MKLELLNLTKRYGTVAALDGISLTFTPGIYGILGANGAGKSTMMKLISDNLKRDSGAILYDDQDILKLGADFRSKLGYMPQEPGMFEQMSAQVFLAYIATLKGIPRKNAKQQITYLLQVTNLSGVKDKPLRGFSGGMRQRVMLAQALLGDPKVLILDEPTAGLDPEERIRIRNYISTFSKGRIVLLATHIVSDIESIANKIVMMKKGRILTVDTPEKLLRSVEPIFAEVLVPETELVELKQRFQVTNVRILGEKVQAKIIGPNAQNEPNSRRCAPSLEDVYLYYLGSGLE